MVTFTVPQHRWKDFFKDRVKVKNKNGNTTRIFHYVSAHTRKDGANVRTHTRGSKDFIYNGYDVRIVIPGRDALPQAMLGIAAMDAEEAEKKGIKTIDITKGDPAQAIRTLFGAE